MSKMRFFFQVFTFLVCAHLGAACPPGPPCITSISPTSSGNNARHDPSPPIMIQIASNKTVSSVKFGSSFSAPFSQSGTTITIAGGILPLNAPETVTVQIVYSDSSVSPSNHPWDYYTYQGEWIVYIPGINASATSTSGIMVVEEGGAALTSFPIPLGGSFSVAITPDGKYAYCVNGDTQSPNFLNNIAVIETATQVISYGTFYSLGILDSFFSFCLAISPDGNKLVTPDRINGKTYSIDISSSKTNPALWTAVEYNTFSLTRGPLCAGFTPNSSSLVYVTNSGENTIDVFDLNLPPSTSNPGIYFDAFLADPEWISPLPTTVNGSPTMLKDLVYCGTGTLSELFEYRNPLVPSSPQVPSIIDVGALLEKEFPGQAFATPDSTRVYATNPAGESIFFIDVATSNVTIIDTGNVPEKDSTVLGTSDNNYGLIITPDGKHGMFSCLIVEGTTNIPAIMTFDTAASPNTANPYNLQWFQPSKISTSVPPVVEFGLGAITPDQSPVAYATYSVNGQTVTFDGTGSLSPTPTTGNIAQYLWHFGDGNTSMLASPTHTYLFPGTYTVTLTVTNDANTSTGQTYFGTMMYNNGGPQAQYSFTVKTACEADLLPPSKAKINQKWSNCVYRNTIIIYAPTSGPAPTTYLIYSDPNRKHLVGRVANTGNPVRVTVAANCQSSCYYIFSQSNNGISCNFLKTCIPMR